MCCRSSRFVFFPIQTRFRGFMNGPVNISLTCGRRTKQPLPASFWWTLSRQGWFSANLLRQTGVEPVTVRLLA